MNRSCTAALAAWMLVPSFGAQAQDRPLELQPEAGAASSAPAMPAAPARSLQVKLLLEGRARDTPHWRRLEPGAALRSGDSVRARVRVSAPAYVYVVQWFSDDGVKVLFPPQGEKQRLVPAGVDVTLPDPGSVFALDAHPGEEQVYVVASARPLADVDPALAAILEGFRNEGSPAVQAAPRHSASAAAAARSSSDAAPAATAETSGPAAPVQAPATSAGMTKKPVSVARKSDTQTPSASRPTQVAPLAMQPPPPNRQLVGMSSRGLSLVADAQANGQSLVSRADEEGVAVLQFVFQHLP